MSKISELSDGGVIQGGDTLIAVRSGGNVKVTYGGSTTANIDGGTIDGTTIGATTPAAGNFTTVTADGLTVDGNTNDDLFNLTGAGTNFELRATSGNGATANSSVYRLALDYLDGTYTNGFIDFYRGGAGNDGYLAFGSTGTERMRIIETGIDVTGTVTADGLTVQTAGPNYLKADQSLGSIMVQTNGANNRAFFAHNGDISFYEDTGTTPKFFWDSSAEQLFIGATSASALNSYSDDLIISNTTFGTGAGISIVSNASNGYSNIHFGDTDDADIARIQYHNATNAMTFRTNATDAVTIDDSQNVGIGTVPGATLHVDDSAPEFRLSQSGTSKVRLRTSGDNYINTGQNLGIGTSSPASLMHLKVAGTTGSNVLSLENDANKYDFRLTSSNLVIRDGSSDRVTLDSSGNLLINTTSPTAGITATSGNSFVYRPAAELTVARQGSGASSPVAIFNQTGDDGQILDLRKDGSTAGSIGVNSTTPYMAGNLGGFRLTSSGGAGVMIPTDTSGNGSDADNDLGISSARWRNLYLSGTVKIGTSGRTTYGSGGFYDNAVQGNNIGIMTGGAHVFLSDGNGAATDNARDIGALNRRIRDVFVGGGVYLGGVASQNKLDDYEEGTWTPTFSPLTGDFASIAYNLQNGRYTKVGNMVTVSCQIRISSWSIGTASGSLRISGLPFNSLAESSTGLASVPLNTQQSWVNAPTIGFVNGSASTVALTSIAEGDASYTFINVSDMSLSGNSNRVRFTATYFTA